MTDSELFEKIKSSSILVAYFSYPDCSVCKTLRPKVKELVKSYEAVEYLYIDTHEHPMVSGQHMVFAVPTVIVFAEGREVKRFSRHFTLMDIKDILERIIDAVP